MMEERAVMRRQSGTPQEDSEELVDLETIQLAPMVSSTIALIPIPATIQSTQIQDQAVPTQTPQTTNIGLENQNRIPQPAPFLLRIFMLNCAKAMTTATMIENFA
jgi:hypothetical protein